MPEFDFLCSEYNLVAEDGIIYKPRISNKHTMEVTNIKYKCPKWDKGKCDLCSSKKDDSGPKELMESRNK